MEWVAGVGRARGGDSVHSAQGVPHAEPVAQVRNRLGDSVQEGACLDLVQQPIPIEGRRKNVLHTGFRVL